ncbi:Ultraviolet-B receptor UVR8, partial [Durusdinium trenchii]
GETPFGLAKTEGKLKVMGVLRPVHVLLMSGEAVSCDPRPDRTVRDLREEVLKKLKLKDTENIELIADGKKLRDQLTLSEANVDYGGSISAVVVTTDGSYSEEITGGAQELRSKYDLQDPQQLIQSLLDANIALVRLEYLQELLAAGRRFLRRQEAEGEFTAAGLPALVQASELQKLEIDPLGNMSLFVKDPSPRRVTVVIESISHAWESMEHPDPHGFQLDQIIQRCPTITSTRSVWLFYDFMSLYQYGGRTPPQEGYFRQALEQMHTLYAHEAIKVRILDELTPETWKHPGTVLVFSDQAGGLIAVSIDQLRANSTPYLLRGWCQAERQWARLRISLEACVPMPPDLFRRKMEEQGLRFTHHDDKETVLKLQAQVFAEKVRTTKQLMAENLDEEALNTLCAALPFYVDLDEIVVNGNVLPRNAAVAVANTNARSFQMESCGLKDEDVEDIVASLLHCNKVEELRLAHNDIGHRGLQALRELKKAKPDLYIDVQLDDQEVRHGYSLNASARMTPEMAN